MSGVTAPVLNHQDVKDPVIKRNFQNLIAYFKALYPSGSSTASTTATATTATTSTSMAASPAVAGVPTGTPLPFCGKNPPAGYLLCGGQAVSRTTYAALFAVIGTTYGSGDGSSTFNVPNGQGVFFRGVGSQTIGSIVYNGGTQGTNQGDQMQGHFHNIVNGGNGVGIFHDWAGSGSADRTFNTGAFSGSNVYFASAPVTDGTNGTPRTGTENRPANFNGIWIIKT